MKYPEWVTEEELKIPAVKELCDQYSTTWEELSLLRRSGKEQQAEILLEKFTQIYEEIFYLTRKLGKA